MKNLKRVICCAILGAGVALTAVPLYAQAPAAPAAKAKNWKAPAHRMYGQQLVDEAMKKHPNLLSMTIQGTPPGEKDIYTMFAGSFPERIGNASDADDIDVIKKGITILDPRWKRTNDKDKKFVVLLPMQDKAGENVGLVVYAFKDPPKASGMEAHYLKVSQDYRAELAKKIDSYKGLFDPVK